MGLCVYVCVCVPVKSHVTSRSGASVRPENPVTYSADNEGQKLWFMADVREAPIRIGTEDPWALTELAKAGGGWGVEGELGGCPPSRYFCLSVSCKGWSLS